MKACYFGPQPGSLPILARDYGTTFPEAAEEEGFEATRDTFQLQLCLLLAECPSPPLEAAMWSFIDATSQVLMAATILNTHSTLPLSTGSPPKLS